MLNCFIDVLGKPYFANEWVAIYNLDCKQGLKKIIDNNLSVDCTLTSPPYNIGKEYEKVLSTSEYVDWLSEISKLVYETTVNNGCYLLNLGYLSIENNARALPITYLIWDKIKFYLNHPH